MGNETILILTTLLLSAFFSGMEIAFVSSNRLKIELDKKQGGIPGKINSFFARNPSRFIGTMLIGNNIVLVLYGIVMAESLEPVIESFYETYLHTHSEGAVTLTQTFLSTILILVTGEFLPKAIFRLNPNRILNVFSVPTIIVYWILYPIASFTVFISEGILRIFGQKPQKSDVTFGKHDLDNLVKEITEDTGGKTENLEHEIKIFRNALEFSSVKARDCMVPRNEIIAVDISEEPDHLRNIFTQTGLSKVIVYEGNIDNIVGYVHSFSMFKMPSDLRSVLHPVLIVAETTSVKTTLSRFIRERKNMAVVVDEFGGTAGIYTTEDAIEEIFGEIEDEHDTEELTEKMISDHQYEFSGRLEITYLNEKYGLGLPESESYNTLAGLILDVTESIPEVNERIEFKEFECTILSASGARIGDVRLIVHNE
jgi:CBS domain containing-hemolysin-like protein